MSRRFHAAPLAGALLVAVVAAAPLAAQRPAAAAPAQQLDPSVNYRLSMGNIEKLVPTARGLSAIQNDADVQAYMRSQKPVFERRMQALQAQGKANDASSIQLLFELLDGQPKVHRAFAAAAITPRDYALTSLHVGLNWMAVVAEKNMGRTATAPDGVMGENWRLVHQNAPRIDQIMTELAKYPVNFGGDDSGE